MAQLTEQATSILEAFNGDDWDTTRTLVGDST